MTRAFKKSLAPLSRQKTRSNNDSRHLLPPLAKNSAVELGQSGRLFTVDFEVRNGTYHLLWSNRRIGLWLCAAIRRVAPYTADLASGSTRGKS